MQLQALSVLVFIISPSAPPVSSFAHRYRARCECRSWLSLRTQAYQSEDRSSTERAGGIRRSKREVKMIILAKQWRMPKFFVVLLLVELPLTVAMLTLMGIAHPNTYRTKLWQNGFDKGFNSAPNSILYDYANWRPAHVPEIWSHGYVYLCSTREPSAA